MTMQAHGDNWTQELAKELLDSAGLKDPTRTSALAYLFRYMIRYAPDPILLTALRIDEASRQWLRDSSLLAIIERLVLNGLYSACPATLLVSPSGGKLGMAMAAGMEVKSILSQREVIESCLLAAKQQCKSVDNPLKATPPTIGPGDLGIDDLTGANPGIEPLVLLFNNGIPPRPVALANQFLPLELLLTTIRGENDVEQDIYIFNDTKPVALIHAHSSLTVSSEGEQLSGGAMNEIYTFGSATSLDPHSGVSNGTYSVSLKSSQSMTCVALPVSSKEILEHRPTERTYK